MRTLIKIQQTPKYNTFDPNIFLTTKRILKWKTHLWLINSQQEEAPLRFPETLKKFNIWWRNMKICLEDGFSENEGFQKMPRVMPKSDEDGYPSPAQNVNKQIGCLPSCIKRALKMEIFWDRVRAKRDEMTKKVSQLSNVSRVGCFVGFRFDNFKFHIFAC